MTQHAPALKANGLTFTYPTASAPTFCELDLSVPSGAVTAILGPNGSGKTTLLHLFLGLLPPSEGTIRLLGKNQSEYSPRAIRQTISLVPQNEIVPFDLNLMEYVLLGRAPFLHLLQLPGERDRKIAENALQTVGLGTMRRRKVTTLSSGEKQLSATARALCQEPEILLMDEPTSHLDLGNQMKILSAIRQLADTGLTILMATHFPDHAFLAASQAAILDRGRITAFGPPDEVLTESILEETYGTKVRIVTIENGIHRKICLPEFDAENQPL